MKAKEYTAVYGATRLDVVDRYVTYVYDTKSIEVLGWSLADAIWGAIEVEKSFGLCLTDLEFVKEL